MDWPIPAALTSRMVGPWDVIDGSLVAMSSDQSYTGIWPAANAALFYPFRVPQPVVITELWVVNGTVVSGNVDIGIYDINGVLLVSAGSTLHAGTSVIQTFNVTDTVIGGGIFYIALTFDNAVARYFGMLGFNRVHGVLEASAFPLPATVTLATTTRSVQPSLGAITKRVP
jgi:hypothetical protein